MKVLISSCVFHLFTVAAIYSVSAQCHSRPLRLSEDNTANSIPTISGMTAALVIYLELQGTALSQLPREFCIPSPLSVDV